MDSGGGDGGGCDGGHGGDCGHADGGHGACDPGFAWVYGDSGEVVGKRPLTSEERKREARTVAIVLCVLILGAVLVVAAATHARIVELRPTEPPISREGNRL